MYLFFTAFGPSLRPIQPPIQWALMSLSPEVKRPGREADHSSTLNAKVKTVWSYISTPLYVSITWRFFKRRGKFSKTLLC
jgi:hypothetical protein